MTQLMSQPDPTPQRPHWRRVLSAVLSLVYHGYRGLLCAVFSFPVAASFVISGLLLDPTIPASAKQNLLLLIIERFDLVFTDSVTLSVIMALAVLLLEPFKYGLVRIRRS